MLLFFNSSSEKLRFSFDCKCRSADLRFRVKRRSRRKRAKTAFRSVFMVRPSGQAGATEKVADWCDFWCDFLQSTDRKGILTLQKLLYH